jgi:hypothetical protein
MKDTNKFSRIQKLLAGAVTEAARLAEDAEGQPDNAGAYADIMVVLALLTVAQRTMNILEQSFYGSREERRLQVQAMKSKVATWDLPQDMVKNILLDPTLPASEMGRMLSLSKKELMDWAYQKYSATSAVMASLSPTS